MVERSWFPGRVRVRVRTRLVPWEGGAGRQGLDEALRHSGEELWPLTDHTLFKPPLADNTTRQDGGREDERGGERRWYLLLVAHQNHDY